MEFDFSAFIGRFHPLLVHLPIGIIVAALLVQFVPRVSRKTKKLLWAAASISSLFTVVTGWFLADTGAYPASPLRWHKWLGIGISALTFLLWFLHVYGSRKKSFFRGLINTLLIGVLIVGGHYGGNLTHGEGFLTDKAPQFIQNLMGNMVEKKHDLTSIPIDSIQLYTHIVRPSLESKCWQCHNPEVKNGGLDMTSVAAMMKGGEAKKGVIPYEISSSEVFQRVALPHSSVKYMPPKGIPISFREIELLKYWIQEGADSTIQVSTIDLTSSIIKTLKESTGIDFSPRPWYEKTKVNPIDSSAIVTIKDQGMSISRFALDNHFYTLRFTENNETLDLSTIAPNILIAECNQLNIKENIINMLQQLTSLDRLDLRQSSFNDDHLNQLKILPKLRVLNMYGTEVTDLGLEVIIDFPVLEKIFLKESKVTKAGVGVLKEKNPELEIIF